LYWAAWEKAITAESWSEVRDSLLQPSVHLRPSIDEKLKRDALSVLAEVHLEKCKSDFVSDRAGQSARVEELRCRVARILRECRDLNILVNPRYFDYIVDLCL